MFRAVINVLLTVDTCESSRADAAGKRLCGEGGGEKVLMVLESKAASFQTERRTTVKVRAFNATDK